MALPGTIQSAAPGLHGIDTDQVLDQAFCSAAQAQGFSFCIRYVSRGAKLPPHDLSVAEAKIILNSGMALMPVQHVAKAGWVPSGSLGQSNGANAAAHVAALGFPQGINVWLDLEGAKSGTSHQDVIDYCNAWFAEVNNAGFLGGVYVGANSVLTGDELFWRLQTKSYWRSGSKVPDVPQRGYQMIQKIIKNDQINGKGIDRNLTQNDDLGGAVQWLTL